MIPALDKPDDASPVADRYASIISAARALTMGEPDGVANMANVAALLWEWLPDINWVGFYRFDGRELVLGPFQGKSACIRIPLDRGVCGAAATTRTVQRVEDVHAFPGHIACDPDSASELVVPIMIDDRLIGVLDIDSPTIGRFTRDDAGGCAALMQAVGPALDSPLAVHRADSLAR